MTTRSEPFIGTEAIAAGNLTRGRLRWNYDAVLPDVYLAKGAGRDLWTRTTAAWLWTGRSAIIAGRAALNRHSATAPVEPGAPVELIGPARRWQDGVIIRDERIDDDEIHLMNDMRMTTPARTALDLARHLPREVALTHLDRLAAATAVSVSDVEELAARHRRARGIARARQLAYLMDGGSASPGESRLRLQLIDGGLPRPETDIVVGTWPESARIALGWRHFKVGVHYQERPPTEDALIIVAANESHWRAIEGWLMLTVVPQQHWWSIVRKAKLALQSRARMGAANGHRLPDTVWTAR